MKIAILLLCHKNPTQINKLLTIMKHSDIEFFLHIDKKSDFENKIIRRSDIHILPNNMRVDVRWGEISQLNAHLNLLYYAKSQGEYDYYWQCSGQDYPLKSSDKIIEYFKDNNGLEFVRFWESLNYKLGKENNLDKRNTIYYPTFMFGRSLWKRILKRIYVSITGGYTHTFAIFRRRSDFARFYGPNWICISNNFVRWILNYLEKNRWYKKSYENSPNPDESFFQTLLMLSPFKDNQHDYLHDIVFQPGANSPDVITYKDYERLKKSPFLMVRKLDYMIDKKILDQLPME